MGIRRKRKGTQLMINDDPFLVNGFNTYWLMVFAVDPLTRHKVSSAFHEAIAAGLNVCRTWAFNDGGWRSLQLSPFAYDQEVFEGLDFVVSEAKRYGLRLILTLCNNWEDYGGKAQYVKWGRSEDNLDLNYDDEFFSDSTIKSYYKAFVEAVVTRVNTFTGTAYKDEPTILAWELINEPRCPSDPSGHIFQAWVEEMASHVKTIDPGHLLGIGLEGFYGPSTPEKLELNPYTSAGQEGTDFVRNHKVSGIDFASVHVYSDTWLPESTSDMHLDFVKSWMNQHMEDAEKLLQMPVVFCEFGVKDAAFGLEFQETFMETVYNTMWSSMEKGQIGGGCILWQLFPEGTEHMDDGYAVILANSPSIHELLSAHSTRIQSKPLESAVEVQAEEENIDH